MKGEMMHGHISNGKAWALLTAVVAWGGAMGCSSMQPSPVPGLGKRQPDNPLPVAIVLTALKAQLASAFTEIEARRSWEALGGSPVTNTFQFKKGSGTFSGTTQTVLTDSGKLLAIIPFTGYAGSTLSPSVGGLSSSTAFQQTALTFSVDPKVASKEVTNALNLQGVTIGTFVQDAVVAAYQEALSIPYDLVNRKPYDPVLQETELSLSVSFTVIRKVEGGITSTILAPAGDLSSIAPTLGASGERTGIYKLELKLPFLTPETADPRRLIYAVSTKNGRLLFVEEPYTQGRYEELLRKNEGAAILNHFLSRPENETEDSFGPLAEPRGF